KLNTGETLNADMALICAGVAPDTHLAKSAGLALNARGAIIVDEYLRTSNKDIYAVGDAIEVKHFVSGMPRHIPLAGPANKQGRLVADNICGLQNAYKGTQGSAILKFFDIAAASTGLNEASAKEAGINYDKVHIYSLSHASYYPGAADLYLKVLFQTDNGRILGAQIVGQEGADKRCDVLATAIRANMTIYDLCELELCYAPPFSSAKDPVNMIGFAAENILTGKLKQFHWHEIDRIRQDKNAIILDTRTDYEYRFGAISGAKHIPLDSLRARIKEIDKSKTVYVYCQSGLRSYLASRILIQEGYDCYNLSGGYRLYSTTEKDSLYDPSPLLPCGAKG
ncbi:MAG: rhodanese-like domain-containing protein, partial [Clostridia bacterium]